MTFLDDIIARKTREVEAAKIARPLDGVKRECAKSTPSLSLKKALDSGNAPRIVSEIKRASPSKGDIRPDLDAAKTALAYRDNGAAAISVLTDEAGFKGRLADLVAARKAIESNRIPLLRKDFVVDEYQIYEAKAAGADAVLLIVAALEKNKLLELSRVVKEAGLEAIVEVHDENEMDIAIEAGAQIIGVNNRNLKTFAIDIGTTNRIGKRAPKNITVIAESGIKTPGDIKKYMDSGFRAFLIGEALVTARDPGLRLKEFLLANK